MDLNPGEILCDGCEGVGKHSYAKTYDRFGVEYETIDCFKCKGTGKLDWIENIVGKKEKYSDVLNSMFGITMFSEKPNNPIDGSCYFNEVDNMSYVYVNNKWTQLGGPI